MGGEGRRGAEFEPLRFKPSAFGAAWSSSETHFSPNQNKMNELTTWTEVFLASMQSFGEELLRAIPAIIGSILILLLGWLFSRLVARGVARLLRAVKFDTLAQKVRATDFLQKAGVKTTPSALFGTFVYWILMLLVIISAAEALGWEAVSNEVSKLVSYLPNLVIAIVLFIVGSYIAGFVRDIIQGATSSLGIPSGRVIAYVVFYLLLILVVLTALEQAGVDTTIITNNLLLILGAVLAAAAISYGLASRDILSNLLAGFYSKRTFQVGKTIELEGLKGKIVEVSNIAVTIQQDDGTKVVVPAHKLITNAVKVLG